jgi:hypothetical protein
MKKIKSKKRNREVVIYAIAALITISVVLTALVIEKKMHTELNSKWPGDCGHFAVWAVSMFHEKGLSPAQITQKISPLVVITGPVTIKETLEEIGINSTFYNNFSISGIKQKIDEGRLVLAMVNINSTKWTDAGAAHYIFIYKYDKNGIFFTDTYYWLPGYLENGTISSYFMPFEEFEAHWQNVMQPRHFIGKIENAVGLNHFAIITDESYPDSINKRMRFAFALQHAAENVIESAGRVIAFLSPRI